MKNLENEREGKIVLDKIRKKRAKSEMEENETPKAVVPAGVEKNINYIILAVSFAMCAFQVYTSATLPLQTLNQRAVHYAFAVVLIFLYMALKRSNRFMRILCYIGAVVGLMCNIYVLMNWRVIQSRAARLTTLDIVIGLLLVVIVIITAIDQIGVWMPMIAVFFLAYCWFGRYLGGMFHISKLSLVRITGYLSFGTEGIFGTCIGAAATFAFIFVLYAECLLQLGAGDFMINIAQGSMGHVRGGPAKIAVVASGLMGMVSGSSVANVAGTGCITIPLMKRLGFKGEFAGGVEAAASTGGGIMPPVMGAAAFVMAEMLNVPYASICVAAFIPAVLYYMCIFVVIDLEAARKGLAGLPKEELPDMKKAFKEGWHFLFSIATLIFLLIGLEWSASKSAFWAMIVLIASDIIRKLITRQQLESKKITIIIVRGCKSALMLSAATACAGIIVGAFAASGLNLRLSSILVSLSGDNLLLLLILSMIAAIILGMGLPTTPVYILLAVLVAPALIQMGVEPMAAHLFLLYYGVMAMITPPVGLAFYVASGIAESNPMKTGFEAVKLAAVGFIIPFIFVYNNGILLMGAPLEIMQVVLTSTLGILGLAFAFQGWFCGKVNLVGRILFALGAVASIVPESFTDIVGVSIIVVLMAIQMIKLRRAKHSLNVVS